MPVMTKKTPFSLPFPLPFSEKMRIRLVDVFRVIALLKRLASFQGVWEHSTLPSVL
jgi:hypothetical protein